jgi:hypothetical protein
MYFWDPRSDLWNVSLMQSFLPKKQKFSLRVNVKQRLIHSFSRSPPQLITLFPKTHATDAQRLDPKQSSLLYFARFFASSADYPQKHIAFRNMLPSTDFWLICLTTTLLKLCLNSLVSLRLIFVDWAHTGLSAETPLNFFQLIKTPANF